MCSLGFSIEYLTSQSNPNGVVIKQTGVMREIENEGKREVLPFIFNLCHRGKYIDCLGLVDGDGRNNNMYIMYQRLGKNENTSKILNFINKIKI